MIEKEKLIALYILLVILILSNTSQIFQGVILGLFSSAVVINLLVSKKINIHLLIMLTIIFSSVTILFFKNTSISLFYFISEVKVLVIFTLPFFFKRLFEKNNAQKILYSFYKIFSVSVFLTLMYGLIIFGEIRYTGFFPHSIYVSVIISILTSLLFKFSGKNILLLNTVNVILLGSSSGSILFLIAILLNIKIPIWKKVLPTFFVALFGYWFIVYYRGREILNGGFWAVDRVQIFMSTLSHSVNNFTLTDWLLGYGIGREITNFSFSNSFNTIADYGFVNWFYYFTSNGVYSFALHNEYWRLVYDYGLLGLFVILFFLYKSIDKATFFILCIGCITNTIIFSTLGLIILSMIISFERHEENGLLDKNQLRKMII